MASGYTRLSDSFEDQRSNYGTAQQKITFARGVSTEYFQLCDKITTNIFTINNATTNLERMGKFIGSRHDSQEIRDRISQLSADTIAYVADTTNYLRAVSQLVQKDRQRKVRVNRLHAEFQTSAARFSELQKKVVATFSNARLPSDMLQTHEETITEMEKDGEQYLAQKQEVLNIEYELAMQQDRQHLVQALEKDMGNINDIMQQLSSMTAEQGEVVAAIEDNVENAASYVEEGRVELIKAASYQNKYRRRCCFLILVTIIILIIIIIIVAMHYTNPN